jgi:multidrug efflux pump subunit AcrA (membrane-fusion protein)
MNRKIFFRLVSIFSPAVSVRNSAKAGFRFLTRRLRPPVLSIAACILIAAFAEHAGSSQAQNSSPNAPAKRISPAPEKADVGQTVAKDAVTVVHPEKSEGTTLQLPGQLSAYTDAPIYAQTSGYLKSWSFDIGAKVKANDILGEIDTPEVDQALAQAKAQLKTDQSALQLAEVTYRRYQLLFVEKVLDAQTRDTSADTYAEDQAAVAADQANIDRLNALEAFKVLRAPFDGIVTARRVDVGAYVAKGSGHELFRVARTSPLRIYVSVPQRDAQLVKIGTEADLTLPQFPNRTFRDGKVELRKITINRDFGNKLEVSEGLSVSDQVILNPSDDLTGGASVRITEPSSHPAASS